VHGTPHEGSPDLKPVNNPFVAEPRRRTGQLSGTHTRLMLWAGVKVFDFRRLLAVQVGVRC
jgi:hypothetical protein